MEHTAKIITIAIQGSDSGMFFASSEDEPGFFVSAFSVDELYEIIPHAIADMFKARDGIKMSAFPTNKGGIGNKPWAVVPVELIAKTNYVEHLEY